MKKAFLLFLTALCYVFAAQAQYENITITTTAGNAKERLIAAVGEEANLSQIKNLKINGTLNEKDFTDITSGRGIKRSLISLDLSGITSIENKKIPEKTFYQWTKLETVILPENNVLTTIADQAFSGCSALASINIPEGVDSIGNNTFSNTGSLKSITLPNSATKLGIGIFSFSGLEQIKLPDNMTTLPGNMFQRSKLTSIDIPKTVTRIERDVFSGASNLKEIKLPEGLLYLSGFRTFSDTGITEINIPEQTQITDLTDDEVRLYQTFQSTKISTFKVPANVTAITSSAFQYTNLSSIIFSESGNLKTLGGLSSTKLVSVKIPEGVTTLEAGLFGGVPTLERVEIPSTVEEIGNGIFSNCTGLKTIVNYSDFPVNLSEAPDVFKNVDQATCVLYVPAEAISAYRDADGWKGFTNIKAIGSDAVEGGDIENFEDLTVEKGSSQITLSARATVGENRPVIYTIEEGKENVVTLEGNILTIVGEGIAHITAIVEGNNDYQEARKTITVTVVDYGWLSAPAIAVHGNEVKVVGPDADKFTKITINGKEGNDLSNETGTIELKATNDNGNEVIRLTINK